MANDPAEWNVASYTPDFCAELGEPLPETANDFRAAAKSYLRVLLAVDEFLTTADDPRAAWIAVAIALRLTSVRELTIADIAGQLGCSPPTINRYISRFAKMADLDSDGQRAGSGGDNPTSILA